MLDDEEFSLVMSKQNPSELMFKARFAPCLDEYERITGFRMTNFNALWHHVLSLYGPPASPAENL